MNFRSVFFATVAVACLAASADAAIVTANHTHNANRNWAPDGVASQTTTAFGAPAERANDNNPWGDFGAASTTHSDDLGVPNSWQVDLTQTRPIDQIVLWNRVDCCGSRLSNFRLSVLNAGLTEVWGQDFYTLGGSVGMNEVVTTPAGTAGQHVRVQQLGQNWGDAASGGRNFVLSLGEVEVFSFFNSGFSNVALGKPASQSTTAFDGDASRATDGNTDGVYFRSNSVTHTDPNVPGPLFLEVDLQGDFRINEISMTNRWDCCMNRLGNFRLSVYDGPAEVWGQDYFVGAPASEISAKGVFSVYDDAGGFFANGDRVRVELIGGRNNASGGPGNDHVLSLAELQVFGVAVPEPTAALLAALGIAGIFRRRRT
jgi:hypothetical protein